MRGGVEGLRGCLGERGTVRGVSGGWVGQGDHVEEEADRG